LMEKYLYHTLSKDTTSIYIAKNSVSW
jgi:hypothetical protein